VIEPATDWQQSLEKMRQAPLELHVNDERQRYFRLGKNKMLFLRLDEPELNQYALVVIKRDSDGTFSRRTQNAEGGSTAMTLPYVRSHTFSFPGKLRWEVTVLRPNQNTHGDDQVDYRMRVYLER